MKGCTCHRVPAPCPVCERAIDRCEPDDVGDYVEGPWAWLDGAA